MQENEMSRMKVSAGNQAAGWLSLIPENLKVSMMATWIIGLIAHTFCYTNILFNHDAAAMYNETMTFGQAAAGSRWLSPIWFAITNSIQMPWLEGVMTLFLYGISAYVLCEAMDVRRKFAVVCFSGIMVVSPCMISSNLYLSSAHVYAIALLAACMSVYAFEKWKYGWLWAALFLLISAGSYGAYVSVSVTAFLFVSIARIISGNSGNFREELWRHVRYLLVFVVSMVLTSRIIALLLSTTQTEAQGRVNSAMSERNLERVIAPVQRAVMKTIDFFSPMGDYSYFQHIPVLYFLFCVVSVASVVLLVWIYLRKRVNKHPGTLVIVFVDLLCLPLAMNVIGAFYDSHTLMQWAFIIPWLFFIELSELALADGTKKGRIKRLSKKDKWPLAYNALVFLLSIVTIYNGIILSNAAYMKAAAVYETSLSVTERIVDRIESLDGYQPGITKVLFLSTPRENYAPYRKAFEITDSITGIGSTWWDTSITYVFPLEAYIHQQLGTSMQIINNTKVYGTAQVADVLTTEQAQTVSPELTTTLQELSIFPSQNCYAWSGDVLIFKLGNG